MADALVVGCDYTVVVKSAVGGKRTRRADAGGVLGCACTLYGPGILDAKIIMGGNRHAKS